MKIIHLSDLHIGYVKGKWNCTKRAISIANTVVSKCKPAHEYVVVISGDIVDKGKRHKQIKQAAELFDIFSKNKIRYIVVPGNHDYGSGLGISLKHQAYFKKKFYGNRDESFPRINVFDNTAFISLDSLQGEFDLSGNFIDGGEDLTGGADGAIGPEQFRRLRKIFIKTEVMSCENRVVLLHHHPIYKGGGFLELKDAKELTQTLEENEVDVLLFGHKHGGDELNNHWGIPRVYDGGSSTGKRMEAPSKIRIIDLSKPPGQYATMSWDIPG